MKLVRVGPSGSECPAILDGAGTLRDISGIVSDIDGTVFSPEIMDQLAKLDLAELPILQEDRFGPCISGVGKVICVGLNYSAHASEAGFEEPDDPIMFMKASSSLCGPKDDVEMPIGGKKLDYEIELGLVIGKTAKNVQVENATGYIGGFCIFNDVSERAFQLEGTGQWVKGKSCDTFGPCGPWLVTPDEVGDHSNLELRLSVNGEIRQSANTKDMLFDVPKLIAFISKFMTLHPGDLIATGTPAGVALGMDTPVYLKRGDVMDLTITGLGQQRSVIG